MSALTPDEIHAVNRTAEREEKRAQARYHGQNHPKAILLAGQPGAGKTMLSSLMLPSLDMDAVLVNGDDYRRYHPDYRTLYEQYGSDAVAMTSPFSSAVTERLIERFSDLRYHMVVEGTGRTVDVPKRTAALLTAKGYCVEMAVIATRPILSLISTVQRFYQMNERGTIPRATAVEAHDKVVSALPANLDVLHELPSISRIMIWTREANLIYDSRTDTSRPSETLKRSWSVHWSPSETSETNKLIAALRELEDSIGLGQSHVIDVIQERFQRESTIIKA
ncbi:MAG: zeta toxin family protein [Oscillospiraceae bacterium]|nr:zeta toxin family protein [Oscillospiraceae bacterium]